MNARLKIHSLRTVNSSSLIPDYSQISINPVRADPCIHSLFGNFSTAIGRRRGCPPTKNSNRKIFVNNAAFRKEPFTLLPSPRAASWP